jgi:hypothetical protein
MFQISDDPGDLLKTAFYFRRICEAGSNAPPNPRYSRWHCELILQVRDHRRIIVGVEECQHQIEPLPIGR